MPESQDLSNRRKPGLCRALIWVLWPEVSLKWWPLNRLRICSIQQELRVQLLYSTNSMVMSNQIWCRNPLLETKRKKHWIRLVTTIRRLSGKSWRTPLRCSNDQILRLDSWEQMWSSRQPLANTHSVDSSPKLFNLTSASSTNRSNLCSQISTENSLSTYLTKLLDREKKLLLSKWPRILSKRSSSHSLRKISAQTCSDTQRTRFST